MNKRSQSVVAIFLALMFQQTWTSSAAEPISVTVKELLTTPAQFDRKQVSVIGYYVNTFKDGSCLFRDRAAAKTSEINLKTIWIDLSIFSPPPPLVGISEPCELKDHYVRIVGTFRFRGVNLNRGFGFGESWSSEITNIINFRAVAKLPDSTNPCGMYKNK